MVPGCNIRVVNYGATPLTARVQRANEHTFAILQEWLMPIYAPPAIQRTSNACSQYSVSKVVETKAQPAVGWEVVPAAAVAVSPLIAAAVTSGR
jgi:hypothetical protein